MIGHRVLSDYKRSEMPAPAPAHLHKTIDADIDTLGKCEFEVRSNSAQAHMSSTVFLERTYTCQQQVFNLDAEYYYDDNESRRVPVDTDMTFQVTPGFALHEQMTNFNVQFKAHSDEDKEHHSNSC